MLKFCVLNYDRNDTNVSCDTCIGVFNVIVIFVFDAVVTDFCNIEGVNKITVKN